MATDRSSKTTRRLEKIAQNRRETAFKVAEKEGLLGRRDGAISGRVPSKLLERARQRSGAETLSELLLYALTKVALEDDFGRRLVARTVFWWPILINALLRFQRAILPSDFN
jgi:hypothetical protein